jgi:hypothetical protein
MHFFQLFLLLALLLAENRRAWTVGAPPNKKGAQRLLSTQSGMNSQTCAA